MSSSKLRHFKVYEPDGSGEPGNFVPVKENSEKFKTVRTVLDRALMILETSPGREALNNLARLIVLGRWESGGPCIYDRNDRGLVNLSRCVDKFLWKVRREFPHVYLTATKGEALTVRENWGSTSSTTDDFVPQTAATMHLHHMVC